MILDKCYDKNGNEIPQDYCAKEFKELSDFLTKIVCYLKANAAQERNQKT